MAELHWQKSSPHKDRLRPSPSEISAARSRGTQKGLDFMDDLMARHAQQQQTPKLVRRSPSPPTPRQRTPTAEARRAQPDTMQLDASSIRRHHLISKGIDPFSVELPSWLPWQSDAGLMHTSKPTDDQPSATTLELLEASRPGTPYLKALRQGGWTPLPTVCFFHTRTHSPLITLLTCTHIT